MNKKVRILLYLTSITAAGIVLLLMLWSGGRQSSAETPGDGVQAVTDVTEIQNDNVVETERDVKSDGVSEEDTVLIFAGDVLIKEESERIYTEEGIYGLIDETLLAEMVNADICMVNHEFQFSTQGEPLEDKQFTFQTDPNNVKILQELGIDIVSLANNHSLDFGKEALLDTMATLNEARILHAGAGINREQAEQLQVIEVNGKKFGFLAATRVIPIDKWNVEIEQPGLFTTYDDTRLLKRIEESKEECDFLTVYVHWGIERQTLPQAYQRAMGERYAKAGADLVIGSHPHVLQGIEYVGDTPIFYSLGNYIFGSTTAKTMLVKVVVKADDTVEYSLIPAFAEGLKTQVYENTERFYDYMNQISTKDFVNAKGSITDKPEQKERNITYEIHSEE